MHAEAAGLNPHCNGVEHTMRPILHRSAALLLPLFLVACGDLPTTSPAPEVSVTEAGPLLECYWVSEGVVRCSDEEPIWDDDCDPYHYDCGADDCIESTGGGDIESAGMEGCPPSSGGGTIGDGGDSGGWTGGGGGSSGTGTSKPSRTPSTTDDVVEQDSLPNCSDSSTWTAVWHGPYCNGSAPTGSLLTAYNAELNAMQAKGGFCAELAQYGQWLLAQGGVRYYTGSGTTLRSWGGPAVGIIMDDGFVTHPAPYDHGFALAHELEHAYTGYRHTPDDVDANGVHRTPHDAICG